MTTTKSKFSTCDTTCQEATICYYTYYDSNLNQWPIHYFRATELWPVCTCSACDDAPPIRSASNYSLVSYMRGIIDQLQANGKIRTSETYIATLKSFMKFRKGQDIMLEGMSSNLMEEYQAWQRLKGLSLNTISFYMRVLRAVYNRAVEENILVNRYPFRRVYTGIGKTIKRALSIELIRKIKKLDLSSFPALDYARDMFIMSFMLRGMSFIDMVFLRKCDLKNGHITYRRRKTGQKLIIEWTKEMQRVLNKYPSNKSDYLLPIIRSKGINERAAYRNTGYNINRNLKTIGRMIGLEIPLTLYVARHSWASVAKAIGIPLSVISEGMGHDSQVTTQIYLANLDSSVIDQANSIILGSL